MFGLLVIYLFALLIHKTGYSAVLINLMTGTGVYLNNLATELLLYGRGFDVNPVLMMCLCNGSIYNINGITWFFHYISSLLGSQLKELVKTWEILGCQLMD